MRTISGSIKSTPVDLLFWYPVPHYFKKHGMSIVISQRTKSQPSTIWTLHIRRFWQTPFEMPFEDRSWRTSQTTTIFPIQSQALWSHIYLVLQTLPGCNAPCKAWVQLNRLLTEHGRFKAHIYSMRLVNDKNSCVRRHAIRQSYPQLLYRAGLTMQHHQHHQWRSDRIPLQFFLLDLTAYHMSALCIRKKKLGFENIERDQGFDNKQPVINLRSEPDIRQS